MSTTLEYDVIAQPAQNITGSIQVPGDKSISHRSIIFGSIATGTTKVKNFLQGDDSLATLQAFRDMGVTIDQPNNGEVEIQGVGLGGLRASEQPLWLGNSGTAMRLMAGLLAAQSFPSVLTGDASLSSRPMKRISTPLIEMGADIASVDGHAPLTISPTQTLNGIRYTLPVASAQIKSALLLAGLYAHDSSEIVEPGISRNHTELMLQSFGVDVQRVDNSVVLKPPQQLKGRDIAVPGDISSAAFFLVAACIAGTGSFTIGQVGVNETRTGVLDILQRMGANITLDNQRLFGQEPVADITIHASQLQGIDIPEHLVPLAIDEFPVLFIAAACAKGQTKLTGAAELRVKESDRISAMVIGLQQLGVHAQALDDGAVIEGCAVAEGGRLGGGTVDSYHDHRIAMAFIIASLAASEDIVVRQCRNIQTSFPGFVDLANSLGLRIHTQ